MASALRFNNLKVAASEQAPRVCLGALGICGIVGYKNDTPYSIGRNLRDSLSPALMVANERIHETNAGLLLIAKDVRWRSSFPAPPTRTIGVRRCSPRTSWS